MPDKTTWEAFRDFMLDSWILRDKVTGFLLQLEGVACAVVSCFILLGAAKIAWSGDLASAGIAVVTALVFVGVAYLFFSFGTYIKKNARTEAEQEEWLNRG